MKKIAIYVDGSNSYFAQDKQMWMIDFKKLYDYCRSFGDISCAKYYSGKSNTEGQQKFFKALSSFGYGLITKPIQENYNKETGETKRKANCDVEICVDMIAEQDKYDTAILVGGDGDFLPLFRHLKDNAKEVIVISNRCVVSKQLVENKDLTYIDMAMIKDDICFKDIDCATRLRTGETAVRKAVSMAEVRGRSAESGRAAEEERGKGFSC